VERLELGDDVRFGVLENLGVARVPSATPAQYLRLFQ